MTLKAHEIEPANELGVRTEFEPGAFQPLVIPEQPADDPFARPCDVAILQQRDRVVGHGTAHGILKIENAGIRLVGDQ